jgi:hypothetical protein
MPHESPTHVSPKNKSRFVGRIKNYAMSGASSNYVFVTIICSPHLICSYKEWTSMGKVFFG